MAESLAPVLTTGQFAAALSAARDVLQVTRDVSPLLVSPHTRPVGQGSAGRARWTTVARVLNYTHTKNIFSLFNM